MSQSGVLSLKAPGFADCRDLRGGCGRRASGLFAARRARNVGCSRYTIAQCAALLDVDLNQIAQVYNDGQAVPRWRCCSPDAGSWGGPLGDIIRRNGAVLAGNALPDGLPLVIRRNWTLRSPSPDQENSPCDSLCIFRNRHAPTRFGWTLTLSQVDVCGVLALLTHVIHHLRNSAAKFCSSALLHHLVAAEIALLESCQNGGYRQAACFLGRVS